jgi:hypothetical protein
VGKVKKGILFFIYSCVWVGEKRRGWEGGGTWECGKKMFVDAGKTLQERRIIVLQYVNTMSELLVVD